MPWLDLFAVQPFVDAATYRSATVFRRAMGDLLARCAELRDPSAPALAVFPENVGTFLALAPLGRLGRRLKSPSVAVGLSLLVRPRALASDVLRHGLGAAEACALRALSPEIRGIYEDTFATLARREAITLVGGTALLSEGGAEVYNASATFTPDGRIAGWTRKVNLVPDLEDVLGLTAGSPEDVSPVDTPAGPIGTLICYDGFAVPHTSREPGWTAVGRRLSDAGARVIAQPAANPWPWSAPWVHRPAGSRMLRREQWRVEGLEATLSGLDGVRYGVTAHLLGRVLGQRFDGQSAIYTRGDGGDVRTLATADAASAIPSSAGVVHARVEAPWLE